MKSNEQKTEWLFINLRWFLLLAVAMVISIDVALRETLFPRMALVLLIVGSVTNVIALIVLLQNNLSRAIRNALLLHDIVLTIGFMAATEGLRSQLLFISLVPITTAALRISWFSSVFITAGVVGIYWFLSWHDKGATLSGDPLALFLQLVPELTNGIVLAVAGLGAGRVADRIKQVLLIEREESETRTNQALRIARQRASLIFELASTLSATLNYERVLEAALDISNVGLREFFRDQRELTQVGLILLFGMDEILYVAKARGLSQHEEDLRFPASRGLLATAINRSDPVVTNSPAEDPELNRIMNIRDCQQAIAIPLRAGYESYGLLVLATPEPDVYTSDFRDLLIAICNQAVLALQNASLYQNLMEEKDRLVTVEEDARKKLARDLHDGPTQTIAAIAMRLNYIRLLVKESPDEATTEIQQLEDLARKTTKEIRQMLFTLRPLILESQGLVPALEQLHQKIGETSKLPVHLEADRQVDRVLNKDAKGAIFYIVEEASTNARKHSQARNIWVRIYQRGMNVVAEVEDDGQGFDVAALEVDYASRGSLGMINLRERAILVKGKTIISSTPGAGTKVTVTVPIDIPQPLAAHEER
jgi:signal transduction histidine kinase